jgi:fatty acid desaturase
MLKPAEVKSLSQISPLRSTLSIAWDWVLIALGFAAMIRFSNPLTYVACLLLVSRQQLALAILMHDGAHRRLYRSHFLNDWIGQFLLAAPLFFAMDSYKKLHLKHHTHPLVADDPDLSLIGGYPISKASFVRKILRDATGVSYFKFIRYFIFMARKKREPDSAPKTSGASKAKGLSPKKISNNTILFSILLVQAVMFSTLYLVGHPWLYLTLWVLPFMTVLQVLLRIRGIAEHAGYQPNENQMLNARTVINPIQTAIFAPHGVNYHIEHHVYPSVPFYRLPEVHRLLEERNSLPSDNVYSGYGQVIADLVR